MFEKLKELHNKLHEQGIRLWFVRDPIKGGPSVSLTLLIGSYCLYVLTLVNKLAGWFGDVDGTFQLLVLSASLYFGRSFSSTGKGKSSSAVEEKEGK
jgi:hypothetical protein